MFNINELKIEPRSLLADTYRWQIEYLVNSFICDPHKQLDYIIQHIYYLEIDKRIVVLDNIRKRHKEFIGEEFENNGLFPFVSAFLLENKHDMLSNLSKSVNEYDEYYEHSVFIEKAESNINHGISSIITCLTLYQQLNIMTSQRLLIEYLKTFKANKEENKDIMSGAFTYMSQVSRHFAESPREVNIPTDNLFTTMNSILETNNIDFIKR